MINFRSNLLFFSRKEMNLAGNKINPKKLWIYKIFKKENPHFHWNYNFYSIQNAYSIPNWFKIRALICVYCIKVEVLYLHVI